MQRRTASRTGRCRRTSCSGAPTSISSTPRAGCSGGPDRRRPVPPSRGHVPRLPGLAARPGVQLRAVGRPDQRRASRRPPTRTSSAARQAREAGAPVLALLRVQRLEQQARVRLGDDPADVRRVVRVGRAEAGADRGRVLAARGGRERRVGRAPSSQKQGVRPIVFPGRGSHANYFKQSIWLGHSAQEGFGCDNTTAPVEHGADAGRADARRAAHVRGRSVRLAHLRRPLGPGGERSEHRPDRPEHQGAVDRSPVTWSEDEWRAEQHRGAAPVDARAERDHLLLRRGRLGLGRLPPFPADALARARCAARDHAARHLAEPADTLEARRALPDRRRPQRRPDLPLRAQDLPPLPLAVPRHRP